ncbi:GRAM domain-containing protein 1B [Liparis tanakae]|uniref:GRAM domain-containing protein 1B n=1 Tax=Liparis tanakae TaxID=230148 RepID=A0A4Z2FXN2_9TELE|nr:GRAM domain-containing protein 1B [Liparis tanakae]
MAATRLVPGTTGCPPGCVRTELHGAHMMIRLPAWQDQHVPFRRSTVASALAGGVKGDVSWLLGDQSWPGKISGSKPAKEEIAPPASSIFPFLSLSLHLSVRYLSSAEGERKEQRAFLGMIRWMNSSLHGAASEDMVVFECVTVANEGCHCLEGYYGEVLRDRVFHPGYGASRPPQVHSLHTAILVQKTNCTASNSNKSTPACSPVLRKRSRSPTPQSQEGENMVEKGSDHSSDKSPSTPEQVVQRTYSLQSARSGGKNSKCHGPPQPPPTTTTTLTSASLDISLYGQQRSHDPRRGVRSSRQQEPKLVQPLPLTEMKVVVLGLVYRVTSSGYWSSVRGAELE